MGLILIVFENTMLVKIHLEQKKLFRLTTLETLINIFIIYVLIDDSQTCPIHMVIMENESFFLVRKTFVIFSTKKIGKVLGQGVFLV